MISLSRYLTPVDVVDSRWEFKIGLQALLDFDALVEDQARGERRVDTIIVAEPFELLKHEASKRALEQPLERGRGFV